MGLSTLYTERFQAIVHEAVTQGINPSAPTKPSGHEWVEAIPAHWQMPRFKYVGRSKTDQALPANGFSDPFGWRTNPATPYFYDLVICKSSLQAFLRNAVPEAAQTNPQHYLYIQMLPTVQQQHPNYWLFVLNSHFAQNWFERELPITGNFAVRSRRAVLSINVLGKLPTFCPPYKEQVAIAAHIQAEQAKLIQFKELLT